VTAEPSSAARLLARILRGDVSAPELAECPVDDLASEADEHGVDRLAWQAITRIPGAPESLVAALESRARMAMAWDLLEQRELSSMLRAVSAAGVRALLIKGTALAYSVYGAPWHRPRMDTDVLVSPEEVAAAGRALSEAGYQRSNAMTSGEFVSHQASFERVDPTGVSHVIDLHWKIVNPQMLADSLPFDELWRDALPIAALDPAARMPSYPASLVLGCIHRLAHHQGHDRLIWLEDIRLLGAQLDTAGWAALARLACERRVAGLCLDGLQQARDQLGATLPPSVEGALAAAAPSEPSHLYLQGQLTRRQVLASDLAALGSWRARLRLIREHAFPPAAFIRERYGVKSPLLLPALYVHRLVTGAHKWVKP
jgi:hypothetical protein